MAPLLIDEFSYASQAHSLPRQLAIRAVEMVSGQPYLKRLYRAYQAEKLPHDRFWSEVIKRLDLHIDLFGADIADIPKTGPLVVVANHPYGVLDGIVICWLVSQIRPDFKILINSVLCRAPEMAAHVLPVDFDETPAALQTNLSSRKLAKEHLDDNGALIVFPSGSISTTPRFFARKAEEIEWAPLVGQLIRKTHAQVLPIYFEGQNSWLFQMASHVSYAMRAALIFHEVRRRVGSRFRGVIGAPLPYEVLEGHLPPKSLAHFLQEHVDELRQNLPFE